MRSMFLATLCLASSAIAGPVTSQNVPGFYVAQLDREETYFRAEIRVYSDGRYTFRGQNADDAAPQPICTGQWAMAVGLLQGKLICGQGRRVKTVFQQFDLEGVTEEMLRSSEGARVQIRSSVIPLAWGPIFFRVWKLERNYFVRD